MKRYHIMAKQNAFAVANEMEPGDLIGCIESDIAAAALASAVHHGFVSVVIEDSAKIPEEPEPDPPEATLFDDD